MKIISTIKTWGLAIAAFSAVLFFALFKNSEAKRAKSAFESSEKARETENRVSQTFINGLQDEQENISNIDLNDDNRLI